MPLDENSPICEDCIGERLVEARISAGRYSQQCESCYETREAITIQELAEFVQPVYEAYVIPIHSEDDEDGLSSSSEIVADLLECGSDVADAIVEYLRSNQILEDDGEPLYDQDTWYRLNFYGSPAYDRESSEWQAAWDDFARDVKHKSRFFNKSGYLTNLFDKLLSEDITGASSQYSKVVQEPRLSTSIVPAKRAIRMPESESTRIRRES